MAVKAKSAAHTTAADSTKAVDEFMVFKDMKASSANKAAFKSIIRNWITTFEFDGPLLCLAN